jgi:hypothetical protein
VFSNSPIFDVIYYILISAGSLLHDSGPLPHTEDGEGPATLRSSTDSTKKLVWCLMYMWSMLYVISDTCLGFRV